MAWPFRAFRRLAGGERAASPSDPRHRFGRAGESAAAEHLAQLGYRILARNFRCRMGEIDLVAMDGDTVVFVEIKSRAGERSELIDHAFRPYRQQQRIQRAAHAVVSKRSLHNQPMRFDLVTVMGGAGSDLTISHHINAFEYCRGRR